MTSFKSNACPDALGRGGGDEMKFNIIGVIYLSKIQNGKDAGQGGSSLLVWLSFILVWLILELGFLMFSDDLYLNVLSLVIFYLVVYLFS